MIDERTIVEQDISGLDFDLPCGRCGGAVCRQPATTVVIWIGTCSHNGGRWFVSDACASRDPEGPCERHGDWGRYEVIG